VFSDTLFDPVLDQHVASGGYYDRIIANPPYGGWLDYDKRAKLKAKYPTIYIKETYGVFLYRCIQLLKDKGILVFIIPDTFLNLHMHTKLRRWLLQTTTVQEISMFPSSFFPDVSFGYANMCIISLQKQAHDDSTSFRLFTNYKKVAHLENQKNAGCAYTIHQADVISNIDHALFVSDNPKIMALINNAKSRIGDIADCVTGFYSGNDKIHLRTKLERKRYQQILPSEVYDQPNTRHLIDGLANGKQYIPIVKGGARKYVKPDEWFMLWTREAVAHYKESKKARFQNASYYFRDGIAVPMVSSSRITASILDKRLFDQSIVGIFPKDDMYKYYLLAFFNSPTCNTLIRTINPSANNSAKYIRKIPFIYPSHDALKLLNERVKEVIDSRKQGIARPKMEEEIEKVIHDIYLF
ncbi:MAG: N-6 DNA methylase, partial [Chloroflexota bacterium]